MNLSVFFLVSFAAAQLRTNFYRTTCPAALRIIDGLVTSEVQQDRGSAAKLLWLAVSDCLSGSGCDASFILAKDYQQYENKYDAGVAIVRTTKASLEEVCPGVVSVADILALASMTGVAAVGGPNWNVQLGRRDSFTPAPANDIPKHTATLSEMTASFAARGLSLQDLVILMGGHTIGYTSFADYNRTNIDPAFATALENAMAPFPLDSTTPTFFDTSYYQNLIQQKGVMACDQALFGGVVADALVITYSINFVWQNAFANSMIKLFSYGVLTGNQGVIASQVE